MSGERVTDLERFEAPWGREIQLQEVEYDGGLRLMRIRIREGRRFTVIELDPGTAAHWGAALTGWAEQANRAAED